MKALRIFDVPSFYMKSFLSRNSIQQDSYEEQMNVFFQDRFGQSNYLSQALNEIEFQTLDLIPNFESAQKSWAKERAVAFEETSWKLQILNEQVKHYKPEILFFVGWGYGYEFIKEIKEKHSCVKRVVLWIGESIPDEKFYQYYDAIITCDQRNKLMFENQGISAFQIHHAFSLKSAEGLKDMVKQNQIGFAGSLKQGVSEHNYRAKVLYNLFQKFDLSAHGLVNYNQTYNLESYKGRFAKVWHELISNISKVSNNWAQLMPKYNRFIEMKNLTVKLEIFEELAGHFKEPLYGKEYLSFVKSSLIVLNSHSNTPFASNMRLFEATGLGACLLTDRKKNMNSLFIENEEVICYGSNDELLEKAQYYMANPTEAIKIGEKAKKAVLNKHTYKHRAPIYVDCFKKILHG